MARLIRQREEKDKLRHPPLLASYPASFTSSTKVSKHRFNQSRQPHAREGRSSSRERSQGREARPDASGQPAPPGAGLSSEQGVGKQEGTSPFNISYYEKPVALCPHHAVQLFTPRAIPDSHRRQGNVNGGLGSREGSMGDIHLVAGRSMARAAASYSRKISVREQRSSSGRQDGHAHRKELKVASSTFPCF